jgi:hypothetical protein
MKGGLIMLAPCRSHKDYQQFVLTELKALALSRPDQIREYHTAISKMIILDLDPLIPILSSMYSSLGRPAEMQVEIFRSLILMNHLGFSLNDWVEKLTFNPVLRVIAGFTLENMPKTSSYYDFINRIVPMDETTALRAFKKKPKDKLKKGEKLPPKNPEITTKLVDMIIENEETFRKRLSRRPERFLQRIFARVSVDASIEMGLVQRVPSVSGDGTCIKTGASPFGKKICNCKENGTYNCTCSRKFSDPSANWGWDSHKGVYFYGYTGYFISTCNKSLKLDLPLYIRLVQASRHDSVSAIFALAEFRELYPNLSIDTFISDSASDNYATYTLLNHWDINAVIALNEKNKGNFKFPPALRINDNGTPICPGGREMINNGFCPDRCRTKWRCPRVAGGLEPCDSCTSCSPSPYGRVIYTKPEWDLRLFTRIPRGSETWKDQMRQRTAAERINDRIMNDYKIENTLTRGKKRISFFTTLAAMNIHLDAQLKILIERKKFDLDKLLFLQNAA